MSRRWPAGSARFLAGEPDDRVTMTGQYESGGANSEKWGWRTGTEVIDDENIVISA
jgi:hypothetical protein